MTSPQIANKSYDYLIDGSEYLSQHSGFKLVGRKEELKDFSNKLMRGDSSNILLVGPGGVGASSLALGLQASKDDPDTPFDIVNKRLYWLDTDGLFSSGDTARTNEAFGKIMAKLTRYPNTVLIIDDAKDFFEGIRNSNCSHLVNTLLREMRAQKLQLIINVNEDDLDMVLKSHSDMREFFTLHDLKEPKAEALREIMMVQKERLEKIHGIAISDEAVDAAIDLTTRYRVHTDLNLSRAQPERTVALLDRALTSYRQNAHSGAAKLTEIKMRIASIKSAIEGKSTTPGLAGKTKEDLETLQTATEKELTEFRDGWETQNKRMRQIYREQRDGEKKLIDLEREIDEQLKLDEQSAEARDNEAAKASKTPDNADRRGLTDFVRQSNLAGYESEAVQELRTKAKRIQTIIDKNKTEFDGITQSINKSLKLGNTHVLETFSSISRIAANKLTQDERQKLLSLEPELSSRVFSQEEAVQKVADTTRVSSTELRDEDKPRGAFIFLGPSGVGKTELATVFNEVMYGDRESLLTIAMGEYKEKHAIAKLIGAPPGYDGYKAGGGILPQSLRANPRRGIIFDEAEKSEPEIFDALMQILDKGELIDNVGRPYSFKDATLFLTSNIGAEYFLDPKLTFEEAKERAIEDLGKKFRPEFLNRFQGRENIICFNRLDLPTVERIARREVAKLNARIEKKNLKLVIPDESITGMCADKYNPNFGARGITGYFTTAVKSTIAKTLIGSPDAKGIMEGRYLRDQKTMVISAPDGDNAANQNREKNPAKTPAQDLKMA